MKYITILGSTGSIGKQTLNVIEKYIDKFTVYALVAKNNVSTMTQQCLNVHPKYVCMIDNHAAKELKNNLTSIGNNKTKILSGMTAACELAAANKVNIVMSAIVGIAGVLPTLSALRAGKKVLLANKEALITCGKLLIKEINKNNSNLLPVDSEHNAIFQTLPESFQKKIGYASLNEYGISKIILTASGGSCRHIPISKLSNITPKQACAHPNWSMGKKISIDSATMMNKGFEYIEACWLFNAFPKQIEILLHPESIIHSIIHYNDGSMIAQLSPADMKIPIAHALNYPKRTLLKNIQQLNLAHIKKLTFDTIDNKRYPCLQLAIEAYHAGQQAIIILNAANEIAVEAFLSKKISFTAIPKIIQNVLYDQKIKSQEPKNIEDVLSIDKEARTKTIIAIKKSLINN